MDFTKSECLRVSLLTCECFMVLYLGVCVRVHACVLWPHWFLPAQCRPSPASPLHHRSERSDLVILHAPAGFTEVSWLCLCFATRESYTPKSQHIWETETLGSDASVIKCLITSCKKKKKDFSKPMEFYLRAYLTILYLDVPDNKNHCIPAI